jgi:primase-polymerase (primpol)-like protein
MSRTPELPWTLPLAFEPMRVLPQWIVYELHSLQAGKYKKRPIDHRSGKLPAKGHGGPEIWTSFQIAAAAAAKLGPQYRVGFYFTEADPFWFLDIDECAILNEKGETRGWSQFAIDLCARFPGAAMEVSSSGRGLHVIGSGKAPMHDCRNGALHVEFYTADRWVALTGINAQGSAASEHTAATAALVAEFFPRFESVAQAGELTTVPNPMWHGPTENEALLKIAMRSRSAASVFNPQDAKPTFKQLWNADADKLAKAWPPEKPNDAYNASTADASLACHLAWYTGGHGERVLEPNGMRETTIYVARSQRHAPGKRRFITMARALSLVPTFRCRTRMPAGSPLMISRHTFHKSPICSFRRGSCGLPAQWTYLFRRSTGILRASGLIARDLCIK